MKPGDVVQLVYNVHVVSTRGDSIEVKDSEKNMTFQITGNSLLKTLTSADEWTSHKKVTKTEMVEKFLSTHGGVFTVTFEKQDGELRKLRGYMTSSEPTMGRSYCVDLDVDSSNRLRLVDHRTIKELIFEGVKYTVK